MSPQKSNTAKRDRDPKSETNQSGTSPPVKSHKTSSSSITKKVATQTVLKRTESLEEIITGARKGLKPIPTPTMAKSTPDTGSITKINEIKDIVLPPVNTMDDNIVVSFIPKSPQETLTEHPKLQMWTEIKSVVPSAKVTYPNDNLSISIKRSDLNTLREITSLDGVEVQLIENPSEIPFRKFSWGKIYAPDLFYDSEDDILEKLKEENYLDIELVKRQRRGEDRNPTRLLKIKFQLPTVPHTIYCLNKEYEVKKYFSPPMRCIQCQK